MTFNNESLHPPEGMRTDDFVLRPIRPSDAELDHAAVMESREFLRLWEQSTWPADDFTVEDNRKDVATLERRHTEGQAFGYTVMNPAEMQCLGCVYVNPPDDPGLVRLQVAPVDGADWASYDAVVAFWVRRSRLSDGLDGRLLEALRGWLERAWPVRKALFQTSEPCEQQVALLESAGLKLRFRGTDPAKPGPYVFFA